MGFECATPITKNLLTCDSSTTAVEPVIPTSRPAQKVELCYLANKSIILEVPFAFPYEVRVIRPDGRIVKAFAGSAPATYSFARSDFKPGVYFVKIDTQKERIIKSIILYH
jgi:hypothetical protein